MKFDINEFEHFIAEKTLKAGLSCFKKGCVKEVDQISVGEYHAEVEGAGRDKETYIVNLNIQKDKLEEYSCTCADSDEGICKHVTAVLFTLQADALNLEKPVKKTRAESKPPVKKATIAEKVNEMLNNVSHEELVDFMNTYAANDKVFRDLIISRFMPVDKESLEIYVKQIKAIVKSASDSYGYIVSGGMKIINKEVSQILTAGRAKFDNGNLRGAFYVAFSVINELMYAMYTSDRASVAATKMIEDSIAFLVEISKQGPPEDLRVEMLNTVLESIDFSDYYRYNYNCSILIFAVCLSRQPKEYNKIKTLLNNLIKSKPHIFSNNFNSFEHMLMLDIITKTESEESVSNYIKTNINNPDFRLMAINKAIAEKDYSKALDLIDDGIKIETTHYDVATKWKKLRLEVFIYIGNNKKIIESAHELLFLFDEDAKSYYDIMHQYVEPEKWNEFVENLIKEITKHKKSSFMMDWSALICDILCWEGQYERALEIVLNKKNIYLYEHCTDNLIKRYNTKFIGGYLELMFKLVKQATTRNEYKHLCKVIQQIKKLDESKQTQEFISKLRELYPRRTALQEELINIS